MGLLGNSGYWGETFGLTTYDEFYDRVGKFLPPLSWWGVGWSTEQSAQWAWDHPFSGAGATASAIAVARNVLGDDPPRLTATSDATSRYLRAVQSGPGALDLGATMTLIIPNVYLCSISATSGGQPVVNVVGLRGSSSGQEVTAAAALKTAWKVASGPLSRLTSSYQLVEFRAMDLSSANGGIAINPDTTLGGITTGQISTNAAAALVKFNGGTRSRSSRGRLYHGPLVEGQINPDGRTIASSELPLLNTAYTNFRSSLSGSGFTLCVVSRKLSAAYDVTSSTTESVIATQRRRIRG